MSWASIFFCQQGFKLSNHVGRAQRAKRTRRPIAIAKPGKALSFPTQRHQNPALVTGFKVTHVAIQHHAQRVSVDQGCAVLQTVHRQPGMQASQRLNNAAVDATHQGQHAADGQALRDALSDGLGRQKLRHRAVPWQTPFTIGNKEFAGQHGIGRI